MKLDRPASQRYWEWMAGLARGDLGTALLSDRPVVELVGERLPVTLQLLGLSLFLALGFAVPVALLAARRPGGLADRLSAVLSLIGLSITNYVLALLLGLVFAVHLGLFGSFGVTPWRESIWGNLHSLTLPAVAIAFPLFAFYTRFLRGDLLEQIGREDYIVTAMAKGVGPWRVLVRHALPNSLFGLLTLVAVNVGSLIGGTVIVEQIYAVPGIGQLLLQAITTRDIFVVQGVVLLLAVITVAANLLVDLLYAALDPRVRHANSA